MKYILGLVGDLIWASFLDDNEWWIKANERVVAIADQPGVIRH